MRFMLENVFQLRRPLPALSERAPRLQRLPDLSPRWSLLRNAGKAGRSLSQTPKCSHAFCTSQEKSLSQQQRFERVRSKKIFNRFNDSIAFSYTDLRRTFLKATQPMFVVSSEFTEFYFVISRIFCSLIPQTSAKKHSVYLLTYSGTRWLIRKSKILSIKAKAVSGMK